MGIGILIVVVGSLIYKGRDRVKRLFNKYRYNEKDQDIGCVEKIN